MTLRFERMFLIYIFNLRVSKIYCHMLYRSDVDRSTLAAGGALYHDKIISKRITVKSEDRRSLNT